MIEFPCDENYLYAKLAEFRVEDKTNTFLLIEEIDDEGMENLKSKFVNLDELNYLAKRLDSFGMLERDKFNTVVEYQSLTSVKDMINLTFNMGHYTLIQDLSSMEEVGNTLYGDT